MTGDANRLYPSRNLRPGADRERLALNEIHRRRLFEAAEYRARSLINALKDVEAFDRDGFVEAAMDRFQVVEANLGVALSALHNEVRELLSTVEAREPDPQPVTVVHAVAPLPRSRTPARPGGRR